MQLYPGNHSIDHAPLATLKVDSFTMRATKPASVSVVCGQLQQSKPGNYYWFTFTGVSIVNISDITFNGCKFGIVAGETDILVNVAFVRSSFVNNTCCNNGGVLDIATAVTTSLVTVKECIFSDNNLESIAIIRNYGNNLTVDQSIFKNNFAIGSSASYDGGGAIYHSGAAHLNILNSNFSNNEIANSLNGGAIYTSGARSTIINCHFNGNVAGANGGAIYGRSSEPIIITNSSFINNTVVSSGGLGGAVYTRIVSITNSIFSDNSAGSTNGSGGAVFVHDGKANVSGSYFSNNIVGGRGGAIATDETNSVLVSNTIFTNNTASSGGGGAIYTGGRYGTMSLVANISILNSTFSIIIHLPTVEC